MYQVQPVLVMQKSGNPVQIKPPHRICKKFAEQKSPIFPCLARIMKYGTERAGLNSWIGPDQFQLRSREMTILLGLLIKHQPENCQREAQRIRNKESRAPPERDRKNRYQQRSHYRPDIRSAIKDSGRQRAFTPRKPVRYGLDELENSPLLPSPSPSGPNQTEMHCPPARDTSKRCSRTAPQPRSRIVFRASRSDARQ